MDQATATISIDDILEKRVAGDFTGATELIAQALAETPENFLDPSIWAQIVNQPATLKHAQDHEANVLFVTAIMMIIDEICNHLDPALSKGLADAFVQGAQFRLTAHSDVDVKALMAMRARIFSRSSFVLSNKDYDFKTPVANPWRPRIGVLFRHLRADPETTSLLPFFSQAKKSGIEVIIFVAEENPTDAFGQRIASSCDRIIRIPAKLSSAINVLRDEDLDVLIFGNDITAKNSLGACLSFHKVARHTICTVSTLVTTASPFINEYFGCDYHAQRGAAGEFVEHFVSLPGPGFAFSFAEENSPSQVTVNRSQLGLGQETVLFASGANYTKLHGAVLDAWAEILRRIPDSALFLYPFPPHFGPAQDAVIARIRDQFTRQGVSAARIIVLPQLPGRQAVRSFLAQMDVGLDSFPYPGVTTMVDAIESNLPTVTLAGQTLRSAQGAAVLSSIGIEELITHNLDQYIETAVTLAQQPDLRKAVTKRIRIAMADAPMFLDEVRFGRAAVHQYFRIHEQLKRAGVPA